MWPTAWIYGERWANKAVKKSRLPGRPITGGKDEARQRALSTIDQASPNAAPANILAIYAATMSPPGEQGKQLSLTLEDPGSTHNLITHNLADALILPIQAISLSLRVLAHHNKERRLRVYVVSIKNMYGRVV